MEERSKQLVTRAAIAGVIAAAIAVGAIVLLLSDTTGKGGSGLGEAFDYDLGEFRKVDASLLKYEETGRIATGLDEVRAVAVGPGDRVFVAGLRGTPERSGERERPHVPARSGQRQGPHVPARSGQRQGPHVPARSGEAPRGTVRVFRPDGSQIREIALDSPPWGLAVDGNSSVCVAMKDRVDIYDGDGGRTASWKGAGTGPFFMSVAVSGDDVFVADISEKVVFRYDRSGKLVNRIGEKDEARGIPGLAIYQPCLDVAAGADGLLRVTNPGRHRIELYTPEGELVAWWGAYSARVEGFCGCCNPVNIALLPSAAGGPAGTTAASGRRGPAGTTAASGRRGLAGTVTAEKFLPRVKVYDDNGALEAVVAGPDDFDGNPKRIDVAVDSRGRILVLDPVQRTVRIFTRRRDGGDRTGAGAEHE